MYWLNVTCPNTVNIFYIWLCILLPSFLAKKVVSAVSITSVWYIKNYTNSNQGQPDCTFYENNFQPNNVHAKYNIFTVFDRFFLQSARVCISLPYHIPLAIFSQHLIAMIILQSLLGVLSLYPLSCSCQSFLIDMYVSCCDCRMYIASD